MRDPEKKRQQVWLCEANPCAEARYSNHLCWQRSHGLRPDWIGQNGEMRERRLWLQVCVFRQSLNACSLLQAAFLLPILQQLMADGVAASRFSELQEPEALIVAPTRELINQIYLEARKFSFGYVDILTKNNLTP